MQTKVGPGFAASALAITLSLLLSSCLFHPMKVVSPVILERTGYREYGYVLKLDLEESGLIEKDNLALFPSHHYDTYIYVTKAQGVVRGPELYVAMIPLTEADLDYIKRHTPTPAGESITFTGERVVISLRRPVIQNGKVVTDPKIVGYSYDGTYRVVRR